ncbi:MAG TPA: glutathione S-transferase family protein [Alphaproteobacteria bacterium]|nr:glutathione S-transferase family protein [Alphaproteobacteria bacterium]
MLQVFGRTRSINVRKVLWTCDEIGVAYEHAELPPGVASLRDPAYLALNPNGLIPVIRDGDFVLWESNAICRYLAAQHGRTDLLPAEPAARALVEQWMDWQVTELNGAWAYAFLALARKDPAYADPQQIAASAAAWNRQMGILDAQLRKTGAHAAGATFTLADIVVGLSVHRWLSTPIAQADCPAVVAYCQRLRSRPAFGPHARAEVP